jgi:dienelactone hydrolase
VRHPGVVLIGGAEGGLHELDAALMAGRGFTVLAQAYFGASGVPPHLVDIPVETFIRSTDWLAAHLAVKGPKVGIIGGSRGGEAALLAGATTPVIGAVVSTVGSGVMTQGIGPGRSFLEIVGTPAASWTLDGQRLPYLPNVVPPQLERQVANGEAIELGLVFEAALAAADAATLEAATIPVERIDGGVLLVSAGDDRSWPCGPLSEIALARLERARHPHPFRHLHYPEAGHPIAPPPYGSTMDLVMPGPGVRFKTGGTPEATARARADAWSQSIRFIREQLTT